MLPCCEIDCWSPVGLSIRLIGHKLHMLQRPCTLHTILICQSHSMVWCKRTAWQAIMIARGCMLLCAACGPGARRTGYSRGLGIPNILKSSTRVLCTDAPPQPRPEQFCIDKLHPAAFDKRSQQVLRPVQQIQLAIASHACTSDKYWDFSYTATYQLACRAAAKLQTTRSVEREG